MRRFNCNSNKNILLILRLTALFIFAFIFGCYYVSSHFDLKDQESIISSFEISNFFENLFPISIIDYYLMLFVGISALTFFCPLAIHLSTIIGGLLYGMSFASSIPLIANNIKCFLVVLISIIVAIIYIYWATFAIKSNRSFLLCAGKSPQNPRIFISADFKKFIFELLKIFILLTIIKVIISFLLNTIK